MNIQIIQTVIAGLLGGGLIGFIEFLIRSKDEKCDKNKEVLEAVKELEKKMDERFNILDAKITEVDEKGDERNAVEARVRILRFADEMMEERRHSKDSWDQCMADCDTYEDYCAEPKHSGFKNNITSATIEYLKKTYRERLEKHDFL